MTFYIPKKALLMCATRLRPQDVFATSLYPGNGGTQTITNGLDLAGKGGLIWTKARNQPYNHELTDTLRGALKGLRSDSTAAENSASDVFAFGSNGFTLKSNNGLGNDNGVSYAAWSFRRAKKFFDIVTYTGNGQSGRQIPHGLGDVPGMIVVKARSALSNWYTWHRQIGNSVLYLDQTSARDFAANTSVLSQSTSQFITVGNGDVNANGVQYVAYLFAQNPDLIDCGSYTGNGASTVVTCGKGWRPQFLMVKNASTTSDWSMFDAARGFSTSAGADGRLVANSSAAEQAGVDFVRATATGFQPTINDVTVSNPGETYVYLAIRAPT